MVDNLPTQIVRFFHRDLSGKTQGQSVATIKDFSESEAGWEETLDLQLVFRLCAGLERAGYLIEARSNHPHPILGRSYIAPTFDARRAEYGEDDFVGYGFARIRDQFCDSVLPVIVKTVDGRTDIGTCFVLGNASTIFTARHVIENMEQICIPTRSGDSVSAREITVAEDPRLDVATILTDRPLEGIPFFRCTDSALLDDVLCLGYPPIPGFNAILVSDFAHVNAEIKSSIGKVVGSDRSYLDRQTYILLNARVKGGNSGGPVVNKQGYVIGILVHAAADKADTQKLDSLGYGIASPKSEWISLLGGSGGTQQRIIPLPFENLRQGGFRTATVARHQ